MSRSSAALDSSSRSGPPPRRNGREHPGGQRGDLECRIADRAGVVARVRRVRERLVELAGQQRHQAEREPQPDPIGRRLRRQLAERHVEAAARGFVPAEPPLQVGQRDRERQAIGGTGAGQRVVKGRPGSDGVTGRRLGVGEEPLRRGASLAIGVGQQPQRGGVEARGGRRRPRLELGGGGAEQRDRVLVTGARGVLDVVRERDRTGAASFELGGGAGVRAEPP